MVLGVFGKCCSKSWKNPNVLFCQLCKPVSRLRSDRHTPADNSWQAFFCIVSSRSINLGKVRDLLCKLADWKRCNNTNTVTISGLEWGLYMWRVSEGGSQDFVPRRRVCARVPCVFLEQPRGAAVCGGGRAVGCWKSGGGIGGQWRRVLGFNRQPTAAE